MKRGFKGFFFVKLSLLLLFFILFIFLSSVKVEITEGSTETSNTTLADDPAQLSFVIETIDDGGSWTSIALDSNDYPHISYVNSQGLRYAQYNGSSWTFETVDASGGGHCSLDLDSNDYPHISYDGLKYAYFNGSSWTIEIVDIEGGHQSSISIDSQDNPHISYLQNGALKYAYSNGGPWMIQVIDGDEQFKDAQAQSLALDSYDNPHVAYHYMDRWGEDIMPWNRNDSLRYAYYDGVSWNIETVDDEGKSGSDLHDEGTHVSIVLDSQDKQHIVYTTVKQQLWRNRLKYAYFDGGSWNIQNVSDIIEGYEDYECFYDNSLALDSEENPHISYFKTRTTGWYQYSLGYASYNGAAWSAKIVDGPVTAPSIVGRRNSIVLDSQGYPHISYIGNSLRYAYAVEAPILTVHTSGVSSHSPVTVTLNGTSVGTVDDGHPLEITIYHDRVPVTVTIGINSTRVSSIDPNSRYSFTGWAGVATGTNTSNPVTITLFTNSSCTANYKTQHLTNITFKDSSGTINLDPTRIEALAPNGSLVTLSIFQKRWLDNGIWTLKQVLWQGNNVKPSIDPIYDPIPNGTWNVNCRVYRTNFTGSFKDNSGSELYLKPSSFKLTFPNGTTSALLKPNLSYYIQNGTTIWSSIIWQGTEVVPEDASFDATNGNPTVNCMVYSLTVDPVFYNNSGTALVQPSSWSIKFPNGTARTASDPVTYNQTQTGNYSIVSIIWEGVEVVPDITPTTSLTSDKSWSPSINCILPTSLSISLSTSTSYAGFKVEINGNLTCNEIGLSGTPILLSYSVTGGETWNDITLANTSSDGSFSAQWMPSATGNYLVRAMWSGDSTYPGTITIVNLVVTSFGEQSVFSVTSNSTVSELAFNSTNRELSFTVTGFSGTAGYVDVYIAKTLVDNIADVKVYLNGDQLNYTATSLDDSWHLHFTYLHSTHKVIITLGYISTQFIENLIRQAVIFTVVSITAIVILILFIMKKKLRSP